jgi:hypothetical protein
MLIRVSSIIQHIAAKPNNDLGADVSCICTLSMLASHTPKKAQYIPSIFSYGELAVSRH